MAEYKLNTRELKKSIPQLVEGDRVLLSGVVYTARDAAHKRIRQLIEDNKQTPFEINDAVIYYCGPTPAPDNMSIGSCGPTTSSRMDVFSPQLLDLGLAAMIGKGERSADVCDAIVRNNAVYFCAIGGAGALASKCITKCDVIAFEDLGCESVKKLEFNDFPLTVAIDSKGNNLFKR